MRSIWKHRKIYCILLAIVVCAVICSIFNDTLRPYWYGIDLSPYYGEHELSEFLPDNYYSATMVETMQALRFVGSGPCPTYGFSSEDKARLAEIFNGARGRYILTEYNGHYNDLGVREGESEWSIGAWRRRPEQKAKQFGEDYCIGITGIEFTHQSVWVYYEVYNAEYSDPENSLSWIRRFNLYTRVTLAVDDPDVRRELLLLAEHVKLERTMVA